jgi:transcriptional regulator with XRE-family HTH domain
MIEAGQNIKAIRELKNYTQDYVAGQLRVSIPTYSNIETGKTEVTLSRLQQIAEIFGVDYQQILRLDRAEILNLTQPAATVDAQVKTGTCCQALLRQLQIKDDQIARLLDILRTT